MGRASSKRRPAEQWIIGAGGFRGEVSLFEPDEHDAQLARRRVRLLELSWFYVHPLRRNQGWGELLLAAATQWADAQRCDLVLWVIPYGAPRLQDASRTRRRGRAGLVAAYTRHGFRSAGLSDPRCMVRRWQTSK